MKFFKHYTDAHEGRSMMALMNEFGLEGYAAYFILMELCGSKLEKKTDGAVSQVDCNFTFSERLVREKLRMRSTKVELFLNSCATKDLLEFSKVKDELHFYVPKLVEILDRDSKRPRSERALPAPKKKNKNKEEELEKELYIANARKASLPAKKVEHVDDVIAVYCNEWKRAYKTNKSPLIGGKGSGLIKTLVKDFGSEKAKELVTAYLQMPDSWFLTKRHDIPTLLQNLNKVSHFLDSGRIITRREIDEIDKNATNQNTLDMLREGKI